MDIRCSMLGHSFQATEVEREHRSSGREEVVTVREYRECRRCGTRELVSENTHVRSTEGMSDDIDGVERPPADVEQTTLVEGRPSTDGGDDAPEEDAEVIEGGRAHRTESVEAGEAPEEEPVPDTDDDIIEASTDPVEGSDTTASVEQPPPNAGAIDRPSSDDNTEIPVYVEVEYYCSNCQFTADPTDSALRPGDICPDCRKGYLAEREG